MMQLIITIVIVLGALAYAVYLLIKRFSPKPRKDKTDCDSCSSDCSNCQLANKTFRDFNP